jgi:hypothetical protein
MDIVVMVEINHEVVGVTACLTQGKFRQEIKLRKKDVMKRELPNPGALAPGQAVV